MARQPVDPQRANILIVDDTPANLDILCALLEGEGYTVSMAPNGTIALKVAARGLPDLILLDVLMPDMDGFEVCRQLRQNPQLHDTPVIFITAQDTPESVVQGFQVGGVDYIAKPFKDAEVLARVKTHISLNRLTRELAQKNEELVEKNRVLEESLAQRRMLKGQLSMISAREAERWGLEGFVGQSATIKGIFKDIRLMQQHATTALVVGESGTGKELIARAIHFGSDRQQGPFVPVNCGALPGELAESLLFGHVKGAFTGADADRMGYFQMAHQGTLFLDEIGDMPLELQVKLLRVLEDGTVRRIGEKQERQVDVRVLAATNADLQKQMRDGTFRQDLYFRLARFAVQVPPLRQRREDIPLLARHFLHLFATEMGQEAAALSDEVMALMDEYAFPGNVRELKNIIERALLESNGGAIEPHHLHFLPEAEADLAPAAPGADAAGDLPFNLERAEVALIKRAVRHANGNISQAARLLGTSRGRIYRALDQDAVRSAGE